MEDQSTTGELQITADMDSDIAETYRQVAKDRGYHFSTFEWLATHDPDFDRVRLSMVQATYTRKDGAVPPKYRELIASAILAFRGYPSLKLHLARALREGATVAEVIQAMEMASIPGGMATLHFAIDQLIELEKEQPELFMTAGHTPQTNGSGASTS
jgi:alkylhydroperoxidase/carboxymuconolactone decarboxylase family protein YurZ